MILTRQVGDGGTQSRKRSIAMIIQPNAVQPGLQTVGIMIIMAAEGIVIEAQLKAALPAIRRFRSHESMRCAKQHEQ